MSVTASRARPGSPSSTVCRAVGCNALILPFALFCDRCWRVMPSDLKRLIEKHHRPNRRPSQVLEKWIAQAMAELLEFKTSGHFRPRPQLFDWDDTPPAPVEKDEPLF